MNLLEKFSASFYQTPQHQLKQSPIGKIPETWEVVKLGEVAEEVYYGITAKAVEKTTDLKLLRTTDIENYSVKIDQLPFCEITDNRKNIEKFLVKKGDLIIARAGTVGISVLINEDTENVIFGSYLIKVRVKERVHPPFLHFFMQSKLYWQHIAKVQGSLLKNLNIPLITSLPLPLPPLSEQKEIARRLQAVDNLIANRRKMVYHVERAKKKMMALLLTGKIRIKP